MLMYSIMTGLPTEAEPKTFRATPEQAVDRYLHEVNDALFQIENLMEDENVGGTKNPETLARDLADVQGFITDSQRRAELVGYLREEYSVTLEIQSLYEWFGATLTLHEMVTEIEPTPINAEIEQHIGNEIVPAMRAADGVSPRVFAAMAARAYRNETPESLALRVLDVDAEAREVLNGEASALAGILFAPSGYLQDVWADRMEMHGFTLDDVGLAFHARDTAARAHLHADMARVEGTDPVGMGLPMYVIDGDEYDVRAAAAWLLVRPRSADRWAMLRELLAA